MSNKVDTYLEDGCMRCPLGATSACKVLQWTAELTSLRSILLDCGLTETLKWGVPCYTFQNKNMFLLSAFKNFCSLNFFKGVLLKDTASLLVKAGEHTQNARLLKFIHIDQVRQLEPTIRAYIYEAIEVEKAGIPLPKKKNSEPIPDELLTVFEEDPVFRSAFEALTPGRQRGYILYFSGAKQAKTRISRIEKCTGQILNGMGRHDAYKRNKKR